MIVLKRIFEFLTSLKLAVMVVLALVVSLSTATILESVYDTQTAQYYVYQSLWFFGVLGLLGMNILCVALDRYPWKPRHTPFLLAHVGILMLLFGSWLTQRVGLDGSIRISEGETSNVVELNENVLMVSNPERSYIVPVKWIPPTVQFKPISAKSYGVPQDIVIDQFLSHADAEYSFVPNPNPVPSQAPAGVSGGPKPALQFRLQGGPMRMDQEFWLWSGDPSTRVLAMGPARFALGEDAQGQPNQPRIEFHPKSDGSLEYRAFTSSGEKKTGRLAAGKISGEVIRPGWKGDLRLTLQAWVPDAVPQSNYKPSRYQYKSFAPPSAIHLRATIDGKSIETWLGLGERANLFLGEPLDVRYTPRRLVLPFEVKLDRFSIEHYEGSRDPKEYSSKVRVTHQGVEKEALISMNRPLDVAGYTLYQASYENAEPRPITTILSVNKDPGRRWKYWGSLLIVFGSILLFVMKYRKKKLAIRANAA